MREGIIFVLKNPETKQLIVQATGRGKRRGSMRNVFLTLWSLPEGPQQPIGRKHSSFLCMHHARLLEAYPHS